MTRLDVHCCALDRQVIANGNWHNGSKRYIKIGRKIYADVNPPVEIVILNEREDDKWILLGQVTKWFKFKFRVRLVLQLWRATA